MPCTCLRVIGNHDAPNASTTTSPRTSSEETFVPSIERKENSTGVLAVGVILSAKATDVINKVEMAAATKDLRLFKNIFFSFLERPDSFVFGRLNQTIRCDS